MVAKRDRTGEESYNKFGSKMVIKEYRKAIDIDIYFPEYDWTFKHTRYNDFKKGKIKCPYEARYYGVGYLGEGKYKVKEDGKNSDEYKIWYDMLRRCYCPKYQEKQSAYKGCSVEEYLLNFQNMGEWIEENYYEVPGEIMCLDKDILCKGNKIYSRNKCIFVPERINTLFTKADKSRGKLPIGIVEDNRTHHFRARCSTLDKNGKIKRVELGSYKTHEEAFIHYKQFKEKYIKQVADEYKPYIPKELYEAMYRWEVDIDD